MKLHELGKSVTFWRWIYFITAGFFIGQMLSFLMLLPAGAVTIPHIINTSVWLANFLMARFSYRFNIIRKWEEQNDKDKDNREGQ